ncbi:MAG: hypothetical protein ACYS8W_16805, partial [Planctomycetota bacterium]
MKRPVRLAFLSLSLVLTLLVGESFAASFVFKGRERNYIVKTARGGKKGVGVLVCLHCNGGNPGTIIGRYANIVSKDGVMCVAPASIAGSQNPWRDAENDGIDFIKALIDQVSRQYKIDRARIYCFGYSAGSCHTMRIGLPNSDFFAGLIGYSGSSMQGLGPRKIPVVSIHGTADRTITIDGTIQMHDILENAGWPHKLFKIEGGGHGYNSVHDREAWGFLMKNPPKDPPEVIAKRAIEEGNAELEKRNYDKAYKAFKEALETGAMQAEANAAITKLIEEGEKAVADAASDKRKLKKLLRAYKGTPVVEKVKAALEKLSEKPVAEEEVKKDKPEPGKKSGTADVTKPSST